MKTTTGNESSYAVSKYEGMEEQDTIQETLHIEDDEELEEELVALAVTDDMPPTQASEESHIDHGSVVQMVLLKYMMGDILSMIMERQRFILRLTFLQEIQWWRRS